MLSSIFKNLIFATRYLVLRMMVDCVPFSAAQWILDTRPEDEEIFSEAILLRTLETASRPPPAGGYQPQCSINLLISSI